MAKQYDSTPGGVTHYMTSASPVQAYHSQTTMILEDDVGLWGPIEWLVRIPSNFPPSSKIGSKRRSGIGQLSGPLPGVVGYVIRRIGLVSRLQE